MSAERIPEATALIRSRALAATQGRWHSDREPGVGHVVDTRLSLIVVGDQEGDRADAEHIASWHPTVALAIADWLDSTHAGLSTHNAMTANSRHAFAVANAYLGEPVAEIFPGTHAALDGLTIRPASEVTP